MGKQIFGKLAGSILGILILFVTNVPLAHAQRPEPRGFQVPFPEGRSGSSATSPAAPGQRVTQTPKGRVGTDGSSHDFSTPQVGIPDTSIKRDYIIGPDDILSITVWDEQDLSRTVVVSPEGDFTYPLIGRMKAAGSSVRDLEREVRDKLSDGFLVDPQVTVQVVEIRSKRIFLLGEVQRPGAYTTAGGISLIQALSMAAGPTENAARELILVRPPSNLNHDTPLLPEEAKGAQLITVPLKSLLEGDLTKNVLVQVGDTVFVPRREFFFVLGQVRGPGKYDLVKGLNVLKAISMAGGFTDKAAEKKVKITRLTPDGKKEEIPVKLEDAVLADDIVFVPESFF